MTDSALDALLATVTAEAGLTGIQVVRGTGKSILVAGEMDGEPAIAKIPRTADPFWVAKWRHEIDLYRSFARERPPVRIPQLKWTNGRTALILEWIGDRPADEGRYLSGPLDAGDMAAVIAAVQAINTWQPTLPGSPARRVMVDYEKRIERYYRRGFFTEADREALAQLLARCGDRREFGHGDLLPANILLGAGHVCTLVDWEFGGQYLPGYDLATLYVLLGDAAPAIRPRIEAAVTSAGMDAEFCVNLACILVRELRIHQELNDTDIARDRLPGLAEAWAQGRRRLHARAGLAGGRTVPASTTPPELTTSESLPKHMGAARPSPGRSWPMPVCPLLIHPRAVARARRGTARNRLPARTFRLREPAARNERATVTLGCPGPSGLRIL